MPITLPIPNSPGGNAHATAPSTYYTGTNLGEYQFISLTEIVNNFTAAYVGEGKILATSLKGDINYHAHRALQELSYDTLVSCKSQEIEVCPSLRMPLPHDYVNYVKLTWSDSNGIEHVLYPAHKTSNPFPISQVDCEYEYDGNNLLQQQNCVTSTKSCGEFFKDNWLTAVNNIPTNPKSFPYSFTIGTTLHSYQSALAVLRAYHTEIDTYCNCLAGNNAEGAVNCGAYYGWGAGCNQPTITRTAGDPQSPCGWSNYDNITGAVIDYTTTVCDGDSDTLSNYSSTTSSSSVNTSNTAATDDDIYPNMAGQRYGIDPQYAQGNGSFFIDCLRGNIHFSSNMAGQTVILKYISDGHGTDDEMIIHKFAEEAMYKWIAYGCTSARMDVPENVIQRLKKERFAETRKAKIRLSNIKIEEISQVFRGKSKWIKH